MSQRYKNILRMGDSCTNVPDTFIQTGKKTPSSLEPPKIHRIDIIIRPIRFINHIDESESTPVDARGFCVLNNPWMFEKLVQRQAL